MALEEYLSSELASLGLSAAAISILTTLFVVYIVVIIGVYIYFSLTLMKVAERTNTDNAWLAWIPIGNLVLMSKIAGMHWWPILLLLGAWVPILGILLSIVFSVFMCIWQWKICEARGKPGWWVLITFVPFVGGIWSFIMWGILAWGQD